MPCPIVGAHFEFEAQLSEKLLSESSTARSDKWKCSRQQVAESPFSRTGFTVIHRSPHLPAVPHCWKHRHLRQARSAASP